MIQDIAPHHLNNAYNPKQPDEKSILLAYRERQVLIYRQDDFIRCPKVDEIKPSTNDLIYLFSVDDITFFLAWDIEEQGDYTYTEMRPLTHCQPRWLAFAVLTGYHLFDWYRSRRYCGRCQSPMEHSQSERALVCPRCHNIEYPRIFPAVIIAVTDKDKILLARYPHRKKNVLLAGFVEIGETLEQTVAREVYEEVGLHVKNITYYRSQPWGIVSDVLAGFYCEVDDDRTIHTDTRELETAFWISREDLEYSEKDVDGSLTSEMIYRFKTGDISLGKD